MLHTGWDLCIFICLNSKHCNSNVQIIKKGLQRGGSTGKCQISRRPICFCFTIHMVWIIQMSCIALPVVANDVRLLSEVKRSEIGWQNTFYILEDYGSFKDDFNVQHLEQYNLIYQYLILKKKKKTIEVWMTRQVSRQIYRGAHRQSVWYFWFGRDWYRISI